MMEFLYFWNLFCVAWLVGSVWWFIAAKLTSKQRHALIDKWKMQIGGEYYCVEEYELISFNRHFWRVFFFRNAKVLYGPLTQEIWDYKSNNCISHDEFWWDCYKYGYRFMVTSESGNRVRYMMAHGGMPMITALDHIIDIQVWINSHKPTPAAPKFTMTEGAEEYEQIMAAQELMQ